MSVIAVMAMQGEYHGAKLPEIRLAYEVGQVN
jgi:hypothetical protein